VTAEKRTRDGQKEFGINGDYMTAGAEGILDNSVTMRVYGQDKPSTPWDDKKGAGMSLGELLKDKVEDIAEDDRDN